MFAWSLKKIGSLCGIAVFLLALDRFLKSLALHFGEALSVALVPGWLDFRLRFNEYIAFSLPVTGPALNILVFIIIIVLLIAAASAVKKQDFSFVWLVLIILGAAANLYDRLVYGAVIDYLDLRWFTVFNLADMMIVGGVAGLIFWQIKKPG
jgi:signal peptidase II